MNKREEQMDNIDAMVFSSDMLWNDIDRQTFKRYLERWSRALADYEKSIEDEKK